MRQELKDVELNNLCVREIRKYGENKGLCHYEAKVTLLIHEHTFTFSHLAFTKEGFIEHIRSYLLKIGYDEESLL